MTTPNGLTEIKRVYGNPRGKNGKLDADWAADNLVMLENLPFPLRLAWEPSITVKRLRCHKLVKDDLRKRLTNIWLYARAVAKKTHGYTLTTAFYDEQALKWLKSQGLDLFGGGFEYRPQVGTKTRMSTHCWGIAFDFDPANNAYRTTGDMPDWWIDIWTTPDPKTGLFWAWGGKFKTPDPMHVQLCTGY